MNWIVRLWSRYIGWCDRMGLTPENRRSCAPRLTDPELSVDSDIDRPDSNSANKSKGES
ncbi:hypothetical protein [Shewanella sediminis]|uniref:hypothetical protein n=1 Tax=Shewanella sediminis TaxID=271097 RepID=UPI0002ECDB42|nr:hypothetical protein [Shewanella sediminis]